MLSRSSPATNLGQRSYGLRLRSFAATLLSVKLAEVEMASFLSPEYTSESATDEPVPARLIPRHDCTWKSSQGIIFSKERTWNASRGITFLGEPTIKTQVRASLSRDATFSTSARSSFPPPNPSVAGSISSKRPQPTNSTPKDWARHVTSSLERPRTSLPGGGGSSRGGAPASVPKSASHGSNSESRRRRSTSKPSSLVDAISNLHVGVEEDTAKLARPQVPNAEGEDTQWDPDSFAQDSEPPKAAESSTKDGALTGKDQDTTLEKTDDLSSVGYFKYSDYLDELGNSPKVHYCSSVESTERVAALFQESKVLGLDLEWQINATSSAGSKANVSLIQLASEERIALFHVAHFVGAVSPDATKLPTLKKVFEDPRITKAGVAIRGDCTRLSKWLGINVQGVFELSHAYKLVKWANVDPKQINKHLVRLSIQARELLGKPLYKGAVRVSDWTQKLNYEQTQYAASDAYVCFQLYRALERRRLSLDPVPPRPAHAELLLPIRIARAGDKKDAEEGDAIKEEEVEPSRFKPRGPETERAEMKRDFRAIIIEDQQEVEHHPTEYWIAKADESVVGLLEEHSDLAEVKGSENYLQAYALWYFHSRTPQQIADTLDTDEREVVAMIKHALTRPLKGGRCLDRDIEKVKVLLGIK